MIYFAHPSSIDYIELYEAILNSADLKQYNFFLPHKESRKGVNSFDIVRNCDLFIAEVSAPSTGLGIEIGRAEAAGVPILLVLKEGAEFSNCFEFVCPKPERLTYQNASDMVVKVSEYLKCPCLNVKT